MEAYEEVFDFVEEFNKRLAARSRVPRRLRQMVLSRPIQGLTKKSHHEEDIDSRKDDLCRGKYLKVIVKT
jgi:hypothetical protein